MLRIKEAICNKWRDIGYLLGISHDRLETWSTKYHQDPERCIDSVLGHWIEKKNDNQYSVSWKGLYDLLIDIQCSEIAHELQRALNCS